VTLLDGTIMVKSTLGSGSIFTVALPSVEQPHPPRVIDLEPVRPPSENNRARVLVAEDNHETQHLIKHILEQHYEVTLVADGETALNLIENTTYDVLLLDIQLAGHKTGVDVLHAVRARLDYKKTPAVAMTAFSVTGDEPYFQSEIGFDGYMRKPFTRDQLLQTMQKALDVSRIRPTINNKSTSSNAG
jgi:CheY-like chemotaxis protein